MHEWRRMIQEIVDEIDRCIMAHNDDALTLRSLSAKLGYSEYHATRKFREISGMSFRDYWQSGSPHGATFYESRSCRTSYCSIM